MTRHVLSRSGTAILAFCCVAPAYAGEGSVDKDPAFDLSLTVAGTSDYRYRGVSLSSRDPALQASVDVSHDSGVYAGVWGTSIAKDAGTRAEIDTYLGWKGKVGPVDFDLAATGYLYPGGRNANYGELNGGVSHAFGPAEVRVGVGYAPAQRNIGGDDNLYLSTDAKFAVTKRLTLTGQIGRERGSLAGAIGQKWDWGAGAEWDQGFATFSLGYVDTNVRRLNDPAANGKAGFVMNLSTGF